MPKERSKRISVNPALESLVRKLQQLRGKVKPIHYSAILSDLESIATAISRPYLALSEQQAPGVNHQFGEAYWVFNSHSSPDQIREALPRARIYANAPPDLELTLIESHDELPDDADLKKRAERQLQGVNEYGQLRAIKARLHGATNRKTGDQLGKILTLVFDTLEKAKTWDEDPLNLFDMGLNDDIYVKVGDRYFDGHEVDEWLPEE